MNVFELFAKLGLDSSEYESGLDRARSMFSSVGGAIGAGVTAMAGATTAAIGAAATGVVNLTSAAVQSYGEFEQLSGGISKLYGTAGQSLEEYAASMNASVDEVRDQFEALENAQSMMAQNAQNAYATAGMSANEYMSSVTSFSSALINSLGGDTERAAEIADMAMRDLADNANTFGTASAQELSNIYSALARGSFQTLDSLNLGFAGTQQGMIDLINASGIFEEQIDSLDNVSFDQMLLAIHNVQENMNIAGATAAEAMGTIEGSMGMLKGAWQNLLTGLGDADADLGGLIDNVVTSALAVVDNIAPVAEQAMSGIAQLIDGLAPVLEEHLPSMIENLLPSLLSAITTIINSVAQALPTIAGVLLPQISSIIQQTLPAILALVPQFISIGGEIIRGVITGLVQNAGEIAQAGLDVLQTLIDGFAEATSGDGISQLVDTTMQIVEMIGTFLVENAPTLITAAVELITQLAMMLTDPSNLQMLIDLSLQLILAIGDGLVQSAPALGNAVVAVIGNLLITLWNELPNILSTIGQLLGEIAMLVIGLIGGLMGQSYDEVISNVSAIFESVSQSLSDAWNGLVEWVGNVASTISGMWLDVGTFFLDGIASVGEAISGWWEELQEFGSNLASAALTWAGDMIDNFVSGIRNGIGAIGDAVSGVADTIAGYIGFSEPEDPRSALHNFHTFAPDMIDLWNSSLEGAIPELSLGMSGMADYIADSMPSLSGAGDMAGVVSMPPIVVQAYFGQEKIDEVMVESNQRIDYISGGRA